MIPRYSDLAANERTYLAWMRTALALIAFGFLLERFDLVLRAFAATAMNGRMQIPHPVAREAGIALTVLGLVIMIISTGRFVTTTRLLKSDKEEAYSGAGVLVTGGIFILLAVFVLVYIAGLLV